MINSICSSSNSSSWGQPERAGKRNLDNSNNDSVSNSREEIDKKISSQLKILSSQTLSRDEKMELAASVIRRENLSEEELRPTQLQERLKSLMPFAYRRGRFCFEVSCLIQSRIDYNKLNDVDKEGIEKRIKELQNKVSDEKQKQRDARREVEKDAQIQRMQGILTLEKPQKGEIPEDIVIINLNTSSSSSSSSSQPERAEKRKFDTPNTANKRVCLGTSSSFEESCKKISSQLICLSSKFLSQAEKLELAKFVIWRENFSKEELSKLQKRVVSLMPSFVDCTEEFCLRIFESIRLQPSYEQLSSNDKQEIAGRIKELCGKISDEEEMFLAKLGLYE